MSSASVALLAGAERPVLLAGGGVLASGACDAVLAFAETTGIPVATTIMGKGAIDERHELSLGVVGTFGCIRANAALIEADAVLVIGSKLDQLSTIGFRMPRRDQRVAHIDIDGEEIGRVTPVEVGAVADAREALTALTEHVAASGFLAADRLVRRAAGGARSAGGRGGRRRRPGRRGGGDRRVVPVRCDARLRRIPGLGLGRALLPGPRERAGRSWLRAGSPASAGPAARPSVRRWPPVGAGWLLWRATEPGVTPWPRWRRRVRMRLPITYVILNNASYGWVAHTETELKLTELSHLGQADYAAAAAALGAKAWQGALDRRVRRSASARR